ncbi:PP2C family protein-serine/threonine phosphatase [Actinoplanes sichuanensis]|uniref:PP2C family protein-serine/threonine phosphatase n=1 Tax=Actinoplanes sichuanensis TaxID=512349 RepID=A0ABW4A5I2_9ACTN
MLRAAVAEVQRAVRAAGRGIAELTGCTLTAFVGDIDGSAWLVQLGDSRAYRLRDGVFELLTSDHTAAWLGILNGWYPPNSREAHRDRHRLTRYAGHPDMPEPDLLNVSLRPGDRFLLCTDGVSDQIHDRRLADALTERTTVVELLAETLDRGGDDNATAVIIQVS